MTHTLDWLVTQGHQLPYLLHGSRNMNVTRIVGKCHFPRGRQTWQSGLDFDCSSKHSRVADRLQGLNEQ